MFGVIAIFSVDSSSAKLVKQNHIMSTMVHNTKNSQLRVPNAGVYIPIRPFSVLMNQDTNYITIEISDTSLVILC